jgi:RNA polymerase sigma-70 factor (ECF subfamily)
MAKATSSLDDENAVEPVAAVPLVPEAVNRIDLERAIARLPDGCRTAFVLHDVEGFEHNEIARLLGISEGTSKSQVHKARLKLRGLLSTVTMAAATGRR